jgi:hypothetical protein
VHVIVNGQAVMKVRALRQTALNRPIPGSDINMIAELTRYGKFVEVPDRLFFRRFDSETTGILMDASTNKGKTVGYMGPASFMQRVRLHSHRFVTTLLAPISFSEKTRVWYYLTRQYAALLPRACIRVLRACIRVFRALTPGRHRGT